MYTTIPVVCKNKLGFPLRQVFKENWHDDKAMLWLEKISLKFNSW